MPTRILEIIVELDETTNPGAGGCAAGPIPCSISSS